MEFHDYAAHETSTLLARLLASRSEASTHQLRTVREALDAAARALEAPSQVDHDIQELVGKLSHAVAEQMRRIGDEAQATVNGVRGELDAQRAETERLAASLSQAEAAANALRTDVQNERERAEAADRDLAVTVEAHAELEKAIEQTEAAHRQEAQARAAAEQAKAAVEDDLRETRGLLELALGETGQLQAQIAGLGGEAAALREEVSSLRGERERTEQERQAIEGARQQEADARSTAERELHEARGLLEPALAETARLGADLEQQTAECVTLRAELANAREIGAERDAMRSHRDGIAAERDAVVAQLEASSGRVHALESSQARHEETIRRLESALEHARQGEARYREQLAHGEHDSSGARAEVESLRGEVDRMIGLFDRSVHAVDALAGVGTVPDLLSALVKGLAVEFPRVALFRVKGNCLEGELQVGFEQTTDVTKFVFPLNLDSLLTRVVTSGAPERLTGGALAERGGTPFGGSPSAALALPIVLQGEPLAVVYAEDSDRGASSERSSVGFAKLLVAQTVVLLMRHTDELKTLNELREYAAMLLREAEQMHAADAEAGKPADEIRKRLKDNLDCARQLYGHRAALEGSAAATLLDEQIAAAIEATTAFAQDLATVVGRPKEKEKKSRRKAEAS